MFRIVPFLKDFVTSSGNHDTKYLYYIKKSVALAGEGLIFFLFRGLLSFLKRGLKMKAYRRGNR